MTLLLRVRQKLSAPACPELSRGKKNGTSNAGVVGEVARYDVKSYRAEAVLKDCACAGDGMEQNGLS